MKNFSRNLFRESFLIYKKQEQPGEREALPAAPRGSKKQPTEYRPPVRDTGAETREHREDEAQCEDIKSRMEQVKEIQDSYYAFMDGLFVLYRRECLEEDVPGKEEKYTIGLLKLQFDNWLEELDLCKVTPEEIENTAMGYFRELQATVSVWQAYESSGRFRMESGIVYGKIQQFMELAPLGSGKVLLIDPNLHTGLAVLGTRGHGVEDNLLKEQDSTEWEKTRKEKVEYFRKRFDEISSGFDFPSFGYWETSNREEYNDKVLKAVESFPDLDKLTAHGAIKILYRFCDQTKIYTEEDGGYSVEQVTATILDDLHYFTRGR